MVLKIGHKREFAQGSHKVHIPVIFALRFWFGKSKVGIGLGMDLEC